MSDPTPTPAELTFTGSVVVTDPHDRWTKVVAQDHDAGTLVEHSWVATDRLREADELLAQRGLVRRSLWREDPALPGQVWRATLARKTPPTPAPDEQFHPDAACPCEATDPCRCDGRSTTNRDCPCYRSDSRVLAWGDRSDPTPTPDTAIVPGRWYREHTTQQLEAEHARRGIPVDSGWDVQELADSLNEDDRRGSAPTPDTAPELKTPDEWSRITRITVEGPPTPDNAAPALPPKFWATADGTDGVLAFLRWLIRLDDPRSEQGIADRRTVTLNQIIGHARALEPRLAAARSVAGTPTPEVGRCGNAAPRVIKWTRPDFCRLPAGHAGWHRGDDGSEWSQEAADWYAENGSSNSQSGSGLEIAGGSGTAALTEDPAQFERIVTVKPAYDCLAVQPCVHGSTRCGTDPGASHGRHNAEMRMTLRSPVAEVTLLVNTGWALPETPEHVRHHGPGSGAVEFHSAMPRYEGHEPQGSRCDRWPVCYGDVGYTMADEPTELLLKKGSDAVWEWLENTYREQFSEGGDGDE